MAKTILVVEDDYITKPFSPRELLARVKAHLRRQQRREADSKSYGRIDVLLPNTASDEEGRRVAGGIGGRCAAANFVLRPTGNSVFVMSCPNVPHWTFELAGGRSTLRPYSGSLRGP